MLPTVAPHGNGSAEGDFQAIELLKEQKQDGDAVRVDAFINFNSFAVGALLVFVMLEFDVLENEVDLFSASIIILMLAVFSTVAAVWLANHVLRAQNLVGQLAFEAILFVLKQLQGYFFLLFFTLVKGNLLRSVDRYGIISVVSFFTLWFFFSKFLEKLISVRKRQL